LEFQEEVVEALALEPDHGQHEGQQNDVDGEEGDGHSSDHSVVARAVLQLNDVHSTEGVDVLVNVAVPVDEHRDQEAQKENVEQVGEGSDVDLALRVSVLREVLVAVDAVEYQQGSLEEGDALVHDEFDLQL